MKVLYITEDYSDSKVHHKLISTLIDKYKDIHVTLYTVVRSSSLKNDITNLYGDVAYDVIRFRLNYNYEFRYKFDFYYKTKIKYQYLSMHTKINEFDLIHAATLFSEGIIAYKIYKEFGIPYLINVRATDVELYLKKMPHLWYLGRKILQQAKKVIFITPNLQDKFKKSISIRRIWNTIQNKCLIIPNGIDDFWINNQFFDRTKRKPNSLLFIGRFDKNKNVEIVIKSILSLRTKYPNISLSLVGGGADKHQQIIKYCESYPESIQYLGKIYDNKRLAEVMRRSTLFIMASHSETFGLVYLEALSQGLPIIYTKGQGVDGMFRDQVGEGVIAKSQGDITSKIDKILSNYNDYCLSYNKLERFSWNQIASFYRKIYINILNNG